MRSLAGCCVVMVVLGACRQGHKGPEATRPEPAASETPTTQKPVWQGEATDDADGKPCMRAGAERYSTQPVACSATCTDQRLLVQTCKNGVWWSQLTEPACQCTPQRNPAALAACQTTRVSLEPAPNLPQDACQVDVKCEELVLKVTCDGENDGTLTSLCECTANGHQVRFGNVFAGEGINTCYEVAAQCRERVASGPAGQVLGGQLP